MFYKNNNIMDNEKSIYNSKILFFDINETILDTSILQVFINDVFNEDVYDLWFLKLLHYSLVSTVTNTFKCFGEISIDALNSIAVLKGIGITKDVTVQLINCLSSLPAHYDVVETLQKLKEKAYTIVALSNSSQDLLHSQLNNAQIEHLFDKQISVENFGYYKPHYEVYNKAARLFNVSGKECMLIATHDWDIYGASCAGWETAFIKRYGLQYSLSLKPNLEIVDLLSLAEKI